MFSLYDYSGGGNFQEAFFQNVPDLPRRGVATGYLNDDNFLDVVQFIASTGVSQLMVLHGNNENGFTAPVISSMPLYWAPVGTISNLNNDEYLDYAVGGNDTLYLFSGSATSEYTLLNKSGVGDSIMTLTSSDFNNDGYDDMAIGVRTGLKIYLGDGAGNLSLQSTYPQLYGSVNIEVTNQGSDFNGDGIYDLCIATPSVGDTSSELVVYLGNGDGTFEQRVVRTVLGQIAANMPADFNGDGMLDIAYLNSAHKYLALIYGDGNGNFTNELRFDVPKFDPSRLICTDFDIDGDVDIAVISYTITKGSSIFYYENQSNPTGFSASSITIQGEDNAQLELISPSNKVLNRVSSTIPTGSYYRRNINQNSILDDYASMSVTESGNYILSVKPEPTQPINTPFTVEFTVNGKLYRLAKDATMSETGYNFNVNFGNGSGYAPKSGSFIYINPPAFLWPNNSAVDFQLAADLDFASIIIDTTIATLLFQPAEALSISDTTTFYWRIRPTGETEFGAMYAFNLVPSSPGCGDIDGLAGPINILDLTYLVDFMFRGGLAPPDLNLADLTNDGNVNILDLTFMIDFIFRGGPPPPC
ncbi:MAG: VCBS repeat-containing protein [candidate division Zixibacteria bacterium]|nr:VCBS repeat-containing protein [candidate division Zixibacteria bacterium]